MCRLIGVAPGVEDGILVSLEGKMRQNIRVLVRVDHLGREEGVGSRIEGEVGVVVVVDGMTEGAAGSKPGVVVASSLAGLVPVAVTVIVAGPVALDYLFYE